jgi:hypothetical protein
MSLAIDDRKYIPSPAIYWNNSGTGKAMNNAINAVIDLEGVLIEICGNWIWLSGDTRSHKDAIKAAGYFWASKKMMWYFRPKEWKSTSRGNFTMEEIRDEFGSDTVKQAAKPKIKIAC